MDAIIELFQSDVTITPKSFNRGSTIKQNWSLPNSIIYYITKYPSNSKGYQKLIQSCKYFFVKNPIIVASFLRSKHVSKALICSKKQKDCENNDGRCCIKIDIKKVTSKIWITGKFEISFDAPTSLLCSKLYKCETYLGLEYKNIFFDDFKFLASSVKRICLSKSLIKYKDGEIVMLEKILECLPKIKWFNL
uniref:Uncharacterized protein n=1 Tax=Panagrolaimus davidi TaxID=227884 RepID=A0A914Q5U7_9BILA